MKIVTVVENISGLVCAPSRFVRHLERPDRHFISEQGFSMLVETDAGHKVLVDTGASETVFLHNLKLCGVEPKDINAAFVTHGHYDHVGGLIPLIEAGVPIYAHPKTFVGRRFSTGGEMKTDISAPPALLEALPKAKLNFVSTLTEILPGVKVSGEIPRVTDFEHTTNFLREEESKTFEDQVTDEQALFLTSKRGLVVISGCAHPGIVNIVTHAKKSTGSKIQLVLGGFHLSGATQDRVRKTMDQLKNLNVERIAPMHCSGFEAMKMISDRFVGFELMPVGSEVEIS